MLQSWETLLQSELCVTNQANYCEESDYTFVTLGTMETHVYCRTNAI